MQAGAVEEQVMDGSGIMELVENERVFSNFVDHKFQELDRDGDGKLSVKELQPAVADIGAALGLPARGSSTDSDYIYTEVLNEFTHGTRKKVTKTEFKKVLSDFLQGMATGLKRDPVVILRIDGEDLHEFVSGLGFEPEMVSIFTHIQSTDKSLRDHMVSAFGRLTVAQGMPPCSDPMVKRNVVEPALQHCAGLDIQQLITQDIFLDQFKKAAEFIAQRLKEQPVIVAHSENTFDGSGVRRLLSNKFELDKALDSAMQTIPKDHHHHHHHHHHNQGVGKTYLRVALDALAPSAGLPPIGAVDEIDKIIVEALAMVNADDGKSVRVDEFKKLLTEVLGSIMLQLEGNPIAVSLNSVVHEPVASSSPLLQLHTSS
uniref:EF-hand domain-containing protein n=1 Tax=Kalanchoe fedtschenkoi TaxID=63787 RepID=A0A7N0U556_KALFE